MYIMKYDHIHPIFPPPAPQEFQSQSSWAAIEPTDSSILRMWQNIEEQSQEGIQYRIHYKKK